MRIRRGEINQQDREPKWFNSPVTIYENRSLDEIQSFIPEFERRRGLVVTGSSSVNNQFDTIIRKPLLLNETEIPIGVVSSDYGLLQHSTVFARAKEVFQKTQISIQEVKSTLRITKYGERMHLSCFLPKKYAFDPGDGNSMDLRLEFFNSVEGSTRLKIQMGWFRFVCSNGLIVGITRFNFKRRHQGDISLEDVQYMLLDGIEESERDKDRFIKWRKIIIKPDCFKEWIENTIHKEWGFKAATRVYHIAQSGHDVKIVGAYNKKQTPFDIPTAMANRVPGCPKKVDNLFDLSQVLAWLAKERRDVQEQLEWVEKIPDLLKPFMN